MSKTQVDEAFAEFVAANLRRLAAYGLAITSNQHDGWDVTQEALSRLYVRWTRVSDPLAYVRTAMTRINIDRVRKRKRETLGAPPDETHVGVRFDGFDEGVLQALQTLSPNQRRAVAMRYVLDMEINEIAEALDCSAVTARTHLSRGLASLRDHSHFIDRIGRATK